MKLLINATSITSNMHTGIERFALHMSQELYRIDANTKVVSTQTIPGIPYSKSPCSIAISNRFFGKREYILRAIWDQTFFRRHLSKAMFDLVFFPIQDGLLFPSVNQIITVHDLHYQHFDSSISDCRNEISRFRTKLYKYKMPHILEHSVAVVAVSESTKQDIVVSFGINPDKIHVIYNGYDEFRFHAIENTQPTLDRYVLQSGNYFLFVGSILKHKNIVRLVQAFARLETEAILVLAGACKDADYLEDIKKAAADLGILETRLRYLEYVSDDDLPFLYNGAISFVLPSLHEGFGVPIIEAMACGTPVITSNCSAMPEIAGDAALLVDPTSVESIAAAMQEILDHPQRAEVLRSAGLERAKQFRWSSSAQKLYEVFKMVSES
ncbi:MAG: hypothetical protein A2X85_13385 [Geobacteraceae bacterium GWF2_54_21]|nr:MAG: hypothetical protein A2X85_13385 [Geobacteraceae bacterium GWF2_54_21]